MSNIFDSIKIHELHALHKGTFSVKGSLIPSDKGVYDVGNNIWRFNTIYCKQLSQIEDTEVVWFSLHHTDLAIPLRFRYVNNNMACLNFELIDLSLKAPDGYHSAKDIGFVDIATELTLTPLTPIGLKWLPLGTLASTIPVTLDDEVSIASINWGPPLTGDYPLNLKFTVACNDISFGEGFSYQYVLSTSRC